MKTFLITLLYIALSIKGISQFDKASIHIGIGAMPVFDVFRLFPENEISGVGVVANFGCFLSPQMSFGVSPYYGLVNNNFLVPMVGSLFAEKQKLELMGLNTYIRYYFKGAGKFHAFLSISGGFANMRIRTTRNAPISTTVFIQTNEPVLTFMPGAGFNYFLSRHIALELHLPYAFLRHLSPNSRENNFATLMPVIGLQFILREGKGDQINNIAK